mgnify:FL=1
MMNSNNNCFNIFIFIVILLWIFFGILSFILSTLFIKKNSLFKLLMLSILFGPLYWLLFLYIENYYSIKLFYRFKK